MAYVGQGNGQGTQHMQWTALATGVVLLMYIAFGGLVSRARGLHKVAAPATTGHPAFERVNRVHQNTGEQLLVFLPSLWMFAVFVSDLWAALLAAVFVAGRLIYAQSYYADAARRGPGYLIGVIAMLALLIGGVTGAFVSA